VIDSIASLSLKCQNCGAPLNIAQQMERITCGYCGSEQIIQRSGAEVSLKIVGDAIAKVQFGVDKSASELAIKRLQAKLQSDTAEWQRCRNQATVAAGIRGFPHAAACCSGVVGLVLYQINSRIFSILGLITMIVSAAAFVYFDIVSGAEKAKKLEIMDENFKFKAEDIQDQLNHHERIVAKR